MVKKAGRGDDPDCIQFSSKSRTNSYFLPEATSVICTDTIPGSAYMIYGDMIYGLFYIIYVARHGELRCGMLIQGI